MVDCIGVMKFHPRAYLRTEYEIMGLTEVNCGMITAQR